MRLAFFFDLFLRSFTFGCEFFLSVEPAIKSFSFISSSFSLALNFFSLMFLMISLMMGSFFSFLDSELRGEAASSLMLAKKISKLGWCMNY